VTTLEAGRCIYGVRRPLHHVFGEASFEYDLVAEIAASPLDTIKFAIRSTDNGQRSKWSFGPEPNSRVY
jgi:hypothetical protein